MTRKKQANQTIHSGGVGEAALVGSANMMMRAYYSTYHLWAAQHFSDLAAQIEQGSGETPRFDIRHRAYVTGSIFASVAFLEAAINELYKDVADSQESYVKSLDDDARKLIKTFWDMTEGRNRSPLSTLDKYQITLAFCIKEQFATGTLPFQSADLVVKLRNELTHYRPESFGGDVEHKLKKQLSGKFSENPLMKGSGNPYFPDKCLGSGCAKWAVQAVKSFADEFFNRLSMTPNYMRVQF